MRQTARSRTLIVTAAALTFVLAGSAVALADTGDGSDHPDTRTDRATDHQMPRVPDRPADGPLHRVVDWPADRPVDRVVIDRPADRRVDRPSDHTDRDLRRSLWKRCLQATESDEISDDSPEFGEICHRLLWKHNAWKRCLQWAAEHTDIPGLDNRRELWRLCHRLLWNHRHAE